MTSPLDLAEPQLNLIQPPKSSRSEVQVNLGMHRQEVRDRPALDERRIVAITWISLPRLIDHNVCEEPPRTRPSVPRRRFAGTSPVWVEARTTTRWPWRKYSKPGRSARPGQRRPDLCDPGPVMAVFSSTLNTRHARGGRYNPIMSAPSSQIRDRSRAM